MMHTIEGVIAQCELDSEEWFPNTAKDLVFQALAMCGEAGEFADQIKKMARGTHTFEQIRKEATEEAIDTFIYLCNIFALLDIHPIEEYNAKRAINAERFARYAAGRVQPDSTRPASE